MAKDKSALALSKVFGGTDEAIDAASDAFEILTAAGIGVLAPIEGVALDEAARKRGAEASAKRRGEILAMPRLERIASRLDSEDAVNRACALAGEKASRAVYDRASSNRIALAGLARVVDKIK
jgi:hypothetical protein